MSAQENPLKVLVVDDEDLLVRSCTRILEGEGYAVISAHTGRVALEHLRRQTPDIILTDLALPDMDGMTILREVKKQDPDAVSIMITAFATVDSSIEAIRAGAYDYIPKPFSAIQLQIVVGRAARQVRLARDNARLRGELRDRYSLENVVGTSASMQAVARLVQRVAPTDASVFLSGESGTGKELVARALHQLSNREAKPFVPVNCAALPDHLLESELFGHEQGAFTGADQERKGLVESAEGGTFFLDEICEMSQELQAKLLRMLQERRVRRVGGQVEIPVDIRVVAATNQDPQHAVRKGVLREDLFFRLNVVPIRLPPLRERPEDIVPLAEHFLRRFAHRYERNAAQPLRLAPDALDALANYDWPGNVRELQNLMERLASLAQPGAEIRYDDLPPPVGRVVGYPSGASPSGQADDELERDLPFHEAKEVAVHAFERRYLRRLLEESDGNISEAARRAGMDRRTIHRMLNKHGLSPVDPGPQPAI